MSIIHFGMSLKKNGDILGLLTSNVCWLLSLTISYEMELHLVHLSSDGKLAVTGIVYEYGRPDPFLSKVSTVIILFLFK